MKTHPSSRQRIQFSTILKKIHTDWMTEDPVAEREMKKFLEQHADDDVNQAVVMYMVSLFSIFLTCRQVR
jgi:hypothetical protein